MLKKTLSLVYQLYIGHLVFLFALSLVLFWLQSLNFVQSIKVKLNLNMPRVFLLIILIWLLYRVAKHLLNKTDQSQQNLPKVENIVKCSSCGLHVPESESLKNYNHVYCNNPDCIAKAQKNNEPTN